MNRPEVNANCAICGGRRARIIFAQPEYRIVQCENCRLSATSPAEYVTTASYDAAPRLAQGYSTVEEKTRGYAQRFIGYVEKHVPKGRFLDVGCSIGVFVDEAKRRGYEAEGIDLDGNAVAYGSSKGRAVSLSSIEDWPRSDYDVIFTSHTLEHVLQPGAFLKACAEHLADGGCLAVIVPCHVGMHPRTLAKWWYGWVPSQHYFHYSPKALDLLLRQTGLTPVRVWQNSMDHRPDRRHIRGAKDALKSLLCYSVAGFGTMVGQGDQLVGIARRQQAAAVASGRS